MKYIEKFATEKVEELYGMEFNPRNQVMKLYKELIMGGYAHAIDRACELWGNKTKTYIQVYGESKEVPLFTKEELALFKIKLLENETLE